MRMRYGVPEREMKDDLNFSAIAHSDKQVSWQISNIVFSNGLVETRRQRFIRAHRELQKNLTNYNFSLHVIFNRRI